MLKFVSKFIEISYTIIMLKFVIKVQLYSSLSESFWKFVGKLK